MKIYTRTGDRGETGLFGGQRVRKDHSRVDAYGAVDELNSILGLAAVQLTSLADIDIRDKVRRVQADLFTIGAQLATPRPEDGGRPSSHIPELPADRPAELERWIDEADEELPPLKNFILPGGSEAGAWLHFARTVCRRAERRVVSLAHEAHIGEDIVIYLNRLSDLLFTLARLANHRAGVAERPWWGMQNEE